MNNALFHHRLCSPLLAGALLLAGCSSPPTHQDTGMIIGGIIGGVLGNELGRHGSRGAATVVGSVIGAAIGGAIGRSMDETDRLKLGHTLETVRTGVPSTWRNPDSGTEYTVVPTRTYDEPTGPCREYTVDAQICGRTEQVYGLACRQADGSWEIRN